MESCGNAPPQREMKHTALYHAISALKGIITALDELTAKVQGAPSQAPECGEDSAPPLLELLLSGPSMIDDTSGKCLERIKTLEELLF